MKKNFLVRTIVSIVLVSGIAMGSMINNSVTAKACTIEGSFVTNRSSVTPWEGYPNAKSVGRHGHVINVSSKLNVRNNPNGGPIGSLDPNETVYVQASAMTSSGTWYFVQYHISGGASKVGWVSSTYMSV